MLLNRDAYEVKPDNLIISSKHPTDIKIIKVKANQGVLERGTVFSLIDNNYVVYGSASNSIENANCILSDRIDTTSDGEEEVAVSVYISGHFNSNELSLYPGTSLDLKSKETLRMLGIYLSSSID